MGGEDCREFSVLIQTPLLTRTESGRNKTFRTSWKMKSQIISNTRGKKAIKQANKKQWQMRKICEKFQSFSLLMAFPLANPFFIPFSRETFAVYEAYINHGNN